MEEEHQLNLLVIENISEVFKFKKLRKWKKLSKKLFYGGEQLKIFYLKTNCHEIQPRRFHLLKKEDMGSLVVRGVWCFFFFFWWKCYILTSHNFFFDNYKLLEWLLHPHFTRLILLSADLTCYVPCSYCNEGVFFFLKTPYIANRNTRKALIYLKLTKNEKQVQVS